MDDDVKMVNITIRVATKDDFGELVRLNGIFNEAKGTADQIAVRLANPKCVEIPIIAVVKNKIVGFAGLRVVPQIFYEGNHAELTELFVESGYRRQGVGRALVEFSERLAEENGAEEFVLHTGQENQTAREFYGAMGYGEWEIVIGKTLMPK